LFVWDSKSRSDWLSTERIKRPFKCPPSFDVNHFEQTTLAIFGDPAASPEERKPLFGLGDCGSMLIAFDGRRPEASRKMVTSLRKSVKGLLNMPNSHVIPFRLCYTNDEFADRSSPPDPLETALIAHNKNYMVPVKARRYLDLPGNNRCRGLNRIPLAMPGGPHVRVCGSISPHL
jgi:hypothetical protein